MNDYIIDSIKKSLEPDQNDYKFIIIDDTFQYKSMRQPFINFARVNGYRILLIFFKVDVEVCVARNDSRRKKLMTSDDKNVQNSPAHLAVTETTIRKMANNFDWASESDTNIPHYYNKNNQETINFLSKDENLPKILDPIVESTSRLAKTSYEIKNKEQIDLNLRSAVQKIYQLDRDTNMKYKKMGKEISRVEKYLLDSDCLSVEDGIID